MAMEPAWYWQVVRPCAVTSDCILDANSKYTPWPWLRNSSGKLHMFGIAVFVPSFRACQTQTRHRHAQPGIRNSTKEHRWNVLSQQPTLFTPQLSLPVYSTMRFAIVLLACFVVATSAHRRHSRQSPVSAPACVPDDILGVTLSCDPENPDTCCSSTATCIISTFGPTPVSVKMN